MRNIIFRLLTSNKCTPTPKKMGTQQVILCYNFIARRCDRILAQWKEVACFSRTVTVKRKR